MHIAVLGMKGMKAYLVKKIFSKADMGQVGLGDTAVCPQGFSSCERQELHLVLMHLSELDSVWVFFGFRSEVQLLWMPQEELCWCGVLSSASSEGTHFPERTPM